MLVQLIGGGRGRGGAGGKLFVPGMEEPVKIRRSLKEYVGWGVIAGKKRSRMWDGLPKAFGE